MNIKEKRELEKQQRRQKRMDEILESAEALFEEKGIKDAKMTDIAKHCELSKGSLYFYFKSKDEIIWELMRKHSVREFEAGASYINDLDGTAYEKLKTYFGLFSKELIHSYTASNLSYQYREYMISVVSQNKLTEEMRDQFEELYKKNLSLIPGLIQAGIADGSIKADINAELIGGGIANAFGSYFRYLVGLKASFEEAFLEKRLEELSAYNAFILGALKGD